MLGHRGSSSTVHVCHANQQNSINHSWPTCDAYKYIAPPTVRDMYSQQSLGQPSSMAQSETLLGLPNSKKCKIGGLAGMSSAPAFGMHDLKSRWHFLRTWVLHLPEDTQECIWKMVYGAVVHQVKNSVVHSSMTMDSRKLVTLSWPRVKVCVLTPTTHARNLNDFGVSRKCSMLMPPPTQRSPLFVDRHTAAYYWTACLVPGAPAQEDLVRLHGWHTQRCTNAGTQHFRLDSLRGRNRPLSYAEQHAINAPCLWTRQHKWCHLAPLALVRWLD